MDDDYLLDFTFLPSFPPFTFNVPPSSSPSSAASYDVGCSYNFYFMFYKQSTMFHVLHKVRSIKVYKFTHTVYKRPMLGIGHWTMTIIHRKCLNSTSDSGYIYNVYPTLKVYKE